MVYPSTHILLRFNGHFGTSGAAADKWSTGVRIGIENTGLVYDADKLQTLVNSAHTAASTFHASAAAFVGNSCYFDQVSGAQIGSSGRYTPDTQQTVVSIYSPVAGAGSATLPWNSACVISLKTARPRGRASNGRMYWPMLAIALTSATGRIPSNSLASRMTAAKAFFDALNTAAGIYQTGARVSVFSEVGLGDMAYVTTIRNDDRVDSIERRENDQPPVWSSATLA